MRLASPISDAQRLRRAAWLALSALACAIALAARAPIHQDPAYHLFADQRTLLGIPSALNVLSNVPFAVVGALGLARLGSARRPPCFEEPAERIAFAILFGGIFLTAFGSAYYHLAPSSPTLFWDRLPMTLGFMSLFAAVLRERVSERLGTLLVGPLVLLGLFSVLVWRLGDADGRGDLRLYAFVQFYPLVSLPLILLLFPPRYAGTRELVLALAWYAAAKLLEIGDDAVFRATAGVVSGHSLKHLAAAMAGYSLVKMAERRRSP